MLKFRILLFTLISCIVFSAKATYPKASHLLDSLDSYIAHQSEFRKAKCNAISAKSNNLQKADISGRNLLQYVEIINDYLHVDADSALYYADSAIRLCELKSDSCGLALAKALRANALSNCGEVYLSTVEFEAINPNDIAFNDKLQYFEVAFKIYSRAFIYLRKEQLQRPFENNVKAALDSLNTVKIDPVKRRYYNDISGIHGKNDVEAIADFIDLLTYSNPGTYQYGSMALQIAQYYIRIKQYDLAKYYFSISAISHIQGGFSETEALHGLGMLLHDEGDFDRANKYMKTALKRAIEDSDDAAAMQIAQSLNSMLEDVNHEASSTKNLLNITMVVLIILIIMGIIMAIYFKNKRNNLNRHSNRLLEKHSSKDGYIRRMLIQYADLLNAFEDYNRYVGRKIKASQTPDLLRVSESGIPVSELLQKFHSNFDNAFLTYFPDFVDNVNSLMSEDKKFAVPSAGTLNTELRYLALMRLGIDDYRQMATFLGINQNSAYTYKNKLKSRAVDRDNFEDNIAKID